jgi:SAM-dependent methyltransferase
MPAPHAPDWWSEFFDDAYAAFGLSDDDDPKVTAAVDFLSEQLQLAAGDRVFDQCCGIGRLSLPLARRGVHVIGVDFTPTYIATALHRAEPDQLPCDFHTGDAHAFTAPVLCDGAFNWFTSFGYENDDARNAQLLHRAFESLRPGGRYVLDYMNVPKVLAQFRPSMAMRDPRADDEAGLVVVTENAFDFERGMIDSTWTFFPPDGSRRTRRVATRLYLPHMLIDLFEQAGFTEVELFGEYDASPYDRLSTRCIVLGHKPG